MACFKIIGCGLCQHTFVTFLQEIGTKNDPLTAFFPPLRLSKAFPVRKNSQNHAALSGAALPEHIDSDTLLVFFTRLWRKE